MRGKLIIMALDNNRYVEDRLVSRFLSAWREDMFCIFLTHRSCLTPKNARTRIAELIKSNVDQSVDTTLH